MIFDRGGFCLQKACRITNLLFVVAQCTVEKRNCVILSKDRGNVNFKSRVYHYRRKNDTILTLFDEEIMSSSEIE